MRVPWLTSMTVFMIFETSQRQIKGNTLVTAPILRLQRRSMSLLFFMVSTVICVAVYNTPIFNRKFQSKHASQKSVFHHISSTYFCMWLFMSFKMVVWSNDTLPLWKFIFLFWTKNHYSLSTEIILQDGGSDDAVCVSFWAPHRSIPKNFASLYVNTRLLLVAESRHLDVRMNTQ